MVVVFLFCVCLGVIFSEDYGWTVGVDAGDVGAAEVWGGWSFLEIWAELVDFEQQAGWRLHPFTVAAKHAHQCFRSVFFGALDDNDGVFVWAEFGGEGFKAVPVVIGKASGVFPDAYGGEEVVGVKGVEARQPAEALAYAEGHWIGGFLGGLHVEGMLCYSVLSQGSTTPIIRGY